MLFANSHMKKFRDSSSTGILSFWFTTTTVTIFSKVSFSVWSMPITVISSNIFLHSRQGKKHYWGNCWVPQLESFVSNVPFLQIWFLLSWRMWTGFILCPPFFLLPGLGTEKSRKLLGVSSFGEKMSPQRRVQLKMLCPRALQTLVFLPASFLHETSFRRKL